MSHKKTKNKKSKKNKRRNLFINILAGFLILLSLALIFNSKIRDLFLVWNTNKYQVNQVTKENIDENLKTEGNFDFDSVKSISSEAVLASQWDAQKLPVIGGIAIPEVEINLPIFIERRLHHHGICRRNPDRSLYACTSAGKVSA